MRPAARQRRSTDGLRVPPADTGAEQAVLGGLMLDGRRAYSRIEGHIAASDFYRHDHALIFRAIEELYEAKKPFDAVTLGDWFEARGKSAEVEGGSYLIEIVSNTPSAANIRAYADIVRDKATLRELIGAGTDIVGDGFEPDGQDVDDILGAAEQRILAVRDRNKVRTEAENGRKGLARTVAAMDARLKAGHGLLGVSTSLPDLDSILLGLQRKTLVVLAARPSMGKSAMMLQLTESCAEHGWIPYTASLEMSSEQLYMRHVARRARVNLKHIQNPVLMDDEEMPKVQRAFERLQEHEWYVDDGSGLTMPQLAARLRREKANHGISVAFIDYLQHMDLGDVASVGIARAIQEVTRKLKELAKELDICIVLLSQLNRGLESRTDKRPVMSDLRESGAIEQDADVIIFLHREGYYQKGKWADDDPRHRIAEIIVAKNRNGETGTITSLWEGKYQCFLPLAREDMPDDYTIASEQANKRGGRGRQSSAGFCPD